MVLKRSPADCSLLDFCSLVKPLLFGKKRIICCLSVELSDLFGFLVSILWSGFLIYRSWMKLLFLLTVSQSLSSPSSSFLLDYWYLIKTSCKRDGHWDTLDGSFLWYSPVSLSSGVSGELFIFKSFCFWNFFCCDFFLDS